MYALRIYTFFMTQRMSFGASVTCTFVCVRLLLFLRTSAYSMLCTVVQSTRMQPAMQSYSTGSAFRRTLCVLRLHVDTAIRTRMACSGHLLAVCGARSSFCIVRLVFFL
jgi:hypothetical protein